jgi:hypothetical protein
MKIMRLAVIMALLGTPVLSFANSPVCNAAAFETKVTWPATGLPVWEFCFVKVNNSSGPRGSGLELRNAYYRGVLVLKRAHAPILFAEYRNGAGGNCYRDWKDENSTILAEPAVRNVLGTSSVFSATTNCDVSSNPTIAYGSCPFGQPGRTAADCAASGTVAVENLAAGAGVRLTTQYTAGWYKYSTRYSFLSNGDIQPEFGFGNSDGTYNDVTHWHQNYWRFDFDIDGANNDELQLAGVPQPLEFSSLRNPRSFYSVFDSAAGFGYQFEPGSNDDTYPANESLRNLHTTDVIGTRYKANEYSDKTTNNLSDCVMTPGTLANGESIANTDVVMYYRASVRDSTSNNWALPGGGFAPQDSMICKRVGPLLRLIGNFPIADGDFSVFKDGVE